MDNKVVLTTAWAERMGLSSRDLADLLDIKLDEVQSCSERHGCPKCGNDTEDSNFRFFEYDPVTVPDEVSGTEYVGCLCGTVYLVGFRSIRSSVVNTLREGDHPDQPGR